MSQVVRTRPTAAPSPKPRPIAKSAPIIHCGDRPGDLRVKVERRQSRGRLAQASRGVRAFFGRVKLR